MQLIDSLRCGGAERMAVTYANVLCGKIAFSGIGVTRKCGLLKGEILPEVEFLFLKRNTRFSPGAVWHLHLFLKRNKINLLHAHGTSIYMGLLLKEIQPGLRLVWHDHYGMELEGRSAGILKVFAHKMDAVVAVNEQLKAWALNELDCHRVVCFPNFLSPAATAEAGRSLYAPNTFKVVCLANFRQQKDHLNLLKAFQIVSAERENVSLHLIGRKEDPDVYMEVQDYIRRHCLLGVYLYGEQGQPEALLRQADLGVLASSSEGLPLALLEYGRQGLAVVCTKVGDCELLVAPFGRLVPPRGPKCLAAAICAYLDDEAGRKKDAANFHNRIMTKYLEATAIPRVLELYESVLAGHSS